MSSSILRRIGAGLITALPLILTPTLQAEGLLGYYPFEGDYDDLSGKDNHAAPVQNPGEVSIVAEGFRGQAADINDPDETGGGNTGGTIDIPINIDPGNLPEVSFGGWVNVESNNAFPGFMATDNGGWDRGLSINTNVWSIASGGNTNSTIAPVLGSWEYVVGTFDGAEAILYVGDDDPANTTTITTSRPDTQTSPGLGFIELGRYDNQDLDAKVDDIFVFDCALSAAKVNAIRNLRLSTLDYTPANAAALFALFDASAPGAVAGTSWIPAAGLAGDPGTVEDLGAPGFGVVLDDLGNGMVGGTDAPADSDEDGLLDSWEEFNFGNLDRDGTGDADSDGLTDLEEFEGATDPNDDDSDNDGLSDGEEVNTTMTDPTKADSDGDGFTDFEEINANPPRDPNDPDSFPPPPPPKIIGYYPFEGSYDDATTNGNHAAPGQNPDTVSIVPDGFRGQGADIDDPAMNGGGNTGGTIDIPINANPDESPAVTFGGWVNLQSNVGFPGFMAIDNGGWDRGMHLNGNAWGIASGGNTPNIAPATVGEWQYVVGTFSKPDNEAILYVGDADPLNQITTTGTRADTGNNPGEVVIEIGRYDNQDLDAIVDDMFVFDGALTAHQVNAIRNLRLSALDVGPDGASELFQLFHAGVGGPAGGLSWALQAGLDATNPGEVFDLGGAIAVVLDNDGNGMRASPLRIGFSVTREPDGSLLLTWDSLDGKLYNLRSEIDPASAEPIDWPIYDGNADIEGTPPENTLNIPFPDDPFRLFVIEEFNAPPVTVLSDDFESGQGDWTTGSDGADGTAWQLGTPTVAGPSAANSPVNCFGTNIDDNHEIDAEVWLRSPPIDLTTAAGATLRYAEFKDIEEGFDFGRVAVLDAADNSVLAVIQEPIDGVSADWGTVTKFLPAEALGKTILIEFRFTADDIGNFAGWYIDDVSVTVP